MQVNPYLFFNGNCEEALKYYEKVLGAKIDAMMRYEGGPAEMPTPPEWKQKIMHASFTIDGEVVMASDALPGDFISRRALRSRSRSRIPPMRRTPLQGAGRRRHREDAVCQDLLLQWLWHVRRQVRHALDGQLPGGRHDSRSGRCVGWVKRSVTHHFSRSRWWVTASPNPPYAVFTGTTGRSRRVRARAAAASATSIRRGG